MVLCGLCPNAHFSAVRARFGRDLSRSLGLCTIGWAGAKALAEVLPLCPALTTLEYGIVRRAPFTRPAMSQQPAITASPLTVAPG